MKNIKKLKVEHAILFVVGTLFIIYLFKSYSADKSSIGSEQMTAAKTQQKYDEINQTGAVQASQPLGHNEVYASAGDVSTSMQGMPPSCNKATADPSELLPKDTNSQWAQLNPTGSGDLQNVNY